MDAQDALARDVPAEEPPRRPDPAIRSISFKDIGEALAAGLRDLQAAPVYGLTFGALYCLGGILIVLFVTALGMPYFAYPLAAGFALLGPMVAIGLYEVSRLREMGAVLSWGAVLRAMKAQARQEIGWMSFVVLFVMIIWLYQVRLLLALFLGFEPISTLRDFLTVVLTTPQGWMFLAIGHVIGAVLSLVLFSLTVVSFPILLDRPVDFITAMITSVRSVVTNPQPMVAWAIMIVALLICATLPMFLGLIVVLPILGHATWHLYRRLVAPEQPAAT
ncbi:MAG TPA: DUF2189 domain-containing protein [Beijerinckiaceae bacterium]|nr:DUF2189 domain-containing protein [Beijerinckiaceae bacterium]